MITDAAIKAAIRRATSTGRPVELKDDGMRGEGRLVFSVRVKDKRNTTEWYACWWRDGRRKMKKIGVYPTLGVAEARKKFREDYLPTISAGGNPEGPRERRNRLGVTIKDLFEAKVDDMMAKGQPSVKRYEYVLLGGSDRNGGLAAALGPNRRACDITAEDIRDELAEIHARGSIVMAAQTRSYVSAAFTFGLASANAYTSAAGRVDWSLKFNPVASIPADPEAKRAGERHLTPSELRHFWQWLEDQDDRTKGAKALRLIAAVGGRVTEILRIEDGTYDRGEAMVDWSKTKNGMPHAIPLPRQAKELLDRMSPNRDGLFFPHQFKRGQPMGLSTLEHIIQRYLKEVGEKEDATKVVDFTPRDLRRTWKTLAGAAGISKEVRDRLQNHARSDVSSRHYDRYDYLPEKRAAMKVWEAYLDRILRGELDNPVTRIDEMRAGQAGVEW